MALEQLDYTAILADLEAKKAALEATIASIRSALSLGTLGQSGDVPPSLNGTVINTYGSPITGTEVPAGAFLGKSIPDAAKLYLAIVKKKQTSREIAEALKRGGMESTSKNFFGNVHSILDRARKQNTGIVKLDRSHWGLAEWYPAGLRSTGLPDKRIGRKKWKNKNKASSGPVAESRGPRTKANELAIEILESKKTGECSLEDMALHLGMGVKGARLILGKMVKAGKLQMSAPGMYKIARPQLVATAAS